MAVKETIVIEVRENGSKVVKKNLESLAVAGGKVESMADNLKTALGSLISARVIRDTVNLADNYANLMNRLRVVTASQKELTGAMEGVAEMSRRTRSSLEANVDMYARMAINTKDLGLAQKDVLRFADQVNKAVLLSGVTAREAQWGMVQFSQALASNALRGDELRAVLEQLPIVTDVIAKHFGVTRGELRQLGFQGRITAAEILEAFENAGDSLDEAFAKRLPTIDQALTVLRGTVIKFIGSQDQMLQGTSDMAKMLLIVADNMDTVGRAVEFAGIAISIYFGTGLVLKLKAVTAQLNATIATFIKLHPMLFVFGAAAVAVATYSDKIKLAKDGTATLADLFVVFKRRVAETAVTIADMTANAFDWDLSEVSTSLGRVLTVAAKAADAFAGFFVAARYVAEQSFRDIASAMATLWNKSLEMWEGITDVAKASIETIKDLAVSAFIGISSAMSSSLRGFREAAKGNFDAASEHAKQAALSIQNAFASNPLESFTNNMQQALSEDSMGAYKIEAERTGEGYAEAISRGFSESNLMANAVEDMFGEAEILAQSRNAGEIAGPGLAVGMTPQELEIFKSLTGDVEKTQQAIQNLSNVAYKNLLLQIKELKAETGGTAEAEANRVAQIENLAKATLDYTDSLAELETLVSHGIIDQETYMNNLDEITMRQKANEDAMKSATITADAYGRTLAKLRMQGLEAATDIGSGFKRGFGEVALEMTDFASAAEDVVTGAFGGMEDALVSFVTTGKVDFRSMVNSILADLTRMIARMAAAKLFESLASSGSGPWGAIFGAVSGAAGGAGRASGGPVSAGGNYTVGENGPEPFVSGSQGRIVNDSARLSSGEAAQPNVTVVVVDSMEKALAAMKSSEGKRIIVNTAGQNQQVINQGN